MSYDARYKIKDETNCPILYTEELQPYPQTETIAISSQMLERMKDMSDSYVCVHALVRERNV